MLRIGIVAGEASGDYLAADLIRAIKQQCPALQVEGIGGPHLQAEGCRILYPSEKLAVMGLVEVAGRYFELSQIRRQLLKHFSNSPPDIFIGVDAPDFNLGLEKSLHAHGIKTAHYVSPSVWAWRQYRIRKIQKSIDLMLVLFPFEQHIYQQHQIPVTYTGHPLADKIAPRQDKSAARQQLGVPDTAKVIAIMPGSRQTELEKMLPLQLDTADWCHQQRNDLVFITSVLSDSALAYIKRVQQARAVNGQNVVTLQVYQNQTHPVLAAADVALLTSGTITLEALLFNLPMVVAYRMHAISYAIIRAMVSARFAALPNLLADEQIVPEFLQQACQPDKMGQALLQLLENDEARNRQIQQFKLIRQTLQCDASARAAEAVLALTGKA